jgi:hypothetical protein
MGHGNSDLPDETRVPHPDGFFSLLLGTLTDVLHLGHEVYQSAFPL